MLKKGVLKWDEDLKGVDTCEISETQPESGWNEKDGEESEEEMWISEV